MSNKVPFKEIIYGLDDDCFMIADHMEIDGFDLGAGKHHFFVHGEILQIDVETKEVTSFGTQCIQYRVELESMFDPEG